MTDSEDALALKQKGNQAFKEHDWPNAIHFYSKAIEANDKDPSFFANRAQVNPHRDLQFQCCATDCIPDKYQIGSIRLRYR